MKRLILALFITVFGGASSFGSYGVVYDLSEEDIEYICGTLSVGYNGWRRLKEELAYITEDDDYETDNRKIVEFFLDHNPLLTCKSGRVNGGDNDTYYKEEHIFKYAADAQDTGFFAELYDAVIETATPAEGKELIDYRSPGGNGEPAGESVLDFVEKLKVDSRYDGGKLHIIERNINAIRFRAL